MNKIYNTSVKVLEYLIIIIFGLLVLDVLFQVFSRYLLNTGFTFTEEFARFSLIWMTILGAAYLTAKNEHLSMDFLYQKMSQNGKLRTSLFVEISIFLFALFIMVIGGFNLVYTTLHLEQLSASLQIPLGYIYMVMPLSGILIMFYTIYHIRNITKLKQEI